MCLSGQGWVRHLLSEERLHRVRERFEVKRAWLELAGAERLRQGILLDIVERCLPSRTTSQSTAGRETQRSVRRLRQHWTVRLISFQVRKFRNVLDSGPVLVEDGATCLVGKNESGKTAALQALHRLNPSVPDTFNLQQHYPRWLLSRDRRSGEADRDPPIEARFELADSDITALSDAIGAQVADPQTITVSRGYDNELHIAPLELRNGVAAHISAIRADADEEPEVVVSDDDLQVEIRNVLASRIPTFFYFGQYELLPGRISLDELSGIDALPASSAVQTVRALLALAGTDAPRLREEDYEGRVSELEAVSEDLTRQVREYWRQNEDLEVVIDIDKETVHVAGSPHQSVTAVARFLDLRVRDRRHGFTNNFAERSTGFRWFFSFLAGFSEFESYDRQVIVLLDEPALTLHARAQADFLHFIDDRLAPEHQVVYTTHSPFMVQADHLERVRIVEDQGPEVGAIISADVTRVGPDSAFPLQGALGYDLGQHLFVGPHNLVVEGTSDFTYLTVISDLLRSQDRIGLDPRWRVLPVGGIQNIPTFVALLGRELDVTVVVDSSNSGMQRLANLSKAGLLESQRIIAMAEFVDAGQADIEDLFDVEDYLKLYNAAFTFKAQKTKLPRGDRIVRRLAQLAGDDDFDHGLPADYLLRNRESILPQLGVNTLARFEHLFERINATLIDSAQ